MAEPDGLGENIVRRYAESPGVIPQRFGMGIVRRLGRHRSSLVGEIQRRWTPEHAEAGGVRWPETFGPVGQVAAVEHVATVARPERVAIAASRSIQRVPAISEVDRSVDSVESPVADAVRDGAVSSSAAMPVVKVAMKAGPAAGLKTVPDELSHPSGDENGPRSGAEAPRKLKHAPPRLRFDAEIFESVQRKAATVETVAAPRVQARRATVQRKVQIQERTPSMLRDAEMASFQVGSGTALPISTVTSAVLPRTIQRSVAPASTVDVAPSISSEGSVKQTGSQSGESSNRTDRTMQQILRRLAIERERRGGSKWL